MAIKRPRKVCVQLNKEKREKCQQVNDCGRNCDAIFTDPLLRESCYGYCKSHDNPVLTKDEIIEQYIGCENYFNRTGAIPPCEGFNIKKDTAQGQAFELESEAGKLFNETQLSQQESAATLQNKLMMILGVVIVALIIYLFLTSKKQQIWQFLQRLLQQQ